MAAVNRVRPCVLFMWEGGNAAEWKAHMEKVLGEFDFRVYPELGAVEEIDYVMTWMPPIGVIGKLPNIKTIFSIGAGVSHILRDPDVPEEIPIVRLTDEGLSLDMALHVAHWVLHFHRHYYLYREQQREAHWQRYPFPANEERRIGILGLGTIGQVIATTLLGMNFDVAGWSRSRKSLAGVESFAGEVELEAFMNRTDILVSVLPPTPATTNLLDRRVLSMLPRGAFVINLGRGEAIRDEDLLELLDEGHIRAAALDVFREEPLPASNPYWRHPNVYVTPHAAGPTNVKYGARRIADNIRTIEEGRAPYPLYDRERGY